MTIILHSFRHALLAKQKSAHIARNHSSGESVTRRAVVKHILFDILVSVLVHARHRAEPPRVETQSQVRAVLAYYLRAVLALGAQNSISTNTADGFKCSVFQFISIHSFGVVLKREPDLRLKLVN
jgi:hypothetical protein